MFTCKQYRLLRLVAIVNGIVIVVYANVNIRQYHYGTFRSLQFHFFSVTIIAESNNLI